MNPYFWLRCKYKIRRKEIRAIEIENLTIIYGEQEVLLMPVSVFWMINVDHDKIHSKKTIFTEPKKVHSTGTREDPCFSFIENEISYWTISEKVK
jgi:hypothetical protein